MFGFNNICVILPANITSCRMKKKKNEEENTSSSSLVSEADYKDNLMETILAFTNTWRMAFSPLERDVEDFDVMRLRHALGLYRSPEGIDLFPRARKELALRGYTFQQAFGSEVMFLVRRGKEISMEITVPEELPDDGEL